MNCFTTPRFFCRKERLTATTVIGKAACISPRWARTLIPNFWAPIVYGIDQQSRVEASIRQGNQPARGVAAADQSHRLTRDTPFLQSQDHRQLVGSSEVHDSDSFARKLGGMINSFLRHQTERELVERGADDHHVSSLESYAQGRRCRR